jgi:hypothetical protein
MPHRNPGDSRHKHSRSIGELGKQRRKARKMQLHAELTEYNRIMQQILAEHPELEVLRGTEEGNQRLLTLYNQRREDIDGKNEE